MKGLLVFLFCFQAVFATKTLGCTGTLTPRQQDSCQLVELYNSTGGVNWTGTKWNTSTPMSGWSGVTLSSSGRVRVLSLLNRGLTGEFPPGFSLSELETLSITFTAKNSNNLSGPLPDFSNFLKLTSLTLTNTNLSDTLPDNLPNTIVSISMTGNQLSGKIPNYSLPNLVTLVLRTNLFTGFKSKMSCPALQSLYLENNFFEDTIPNFNLPALKILNLSNNGFTGAAPQFDSLPSIEEIYLQLNELTGELPALNIHTLKRLNLTTNKLNGQIPQLSLPNLIELRLSDNLFTGFFPNLNLPELQLFYLSMNPGITGSLPPFDSMPNLKLLSAIGNKVNGPLPLFSNNTIIEQILLNKNSLDDTIPNYNLLFLKKLHLQDNELMKGDLKNFNLPELEELVISGNMITGALPIFNSMPKLKILNLANNGINGQLPLGINLPLLENMNLSGNKLSGKLRENFLEYTPKILDLNLGNNYLEDTIPDLISSSLVELSLQYNKFQGSMPSFLNALKLKRIYVDHNYLSGNIPDYKSQAGRDTSKMILNISKNYFNFGDIATSSHASIDNYSYNGQIIPLYHNASEKKLYVDAGYVSNPSENTYQWTKVCGSTSTILPETSAVLTLPDVPDSCRYRCAITSSVLTKNTTVVLTNHYTGLYKQLILSSYFFTYNNAISSCSYLDDTLYCKNVLGEIQQNIVYTGDSLFSKGITPLHFKYPENYVEKRTFMTSSEAVGELAFDTTNFNQSEIILPDYVTDYIKVPGKAKKILGSTDYEIKNQAIGVNETISFSDIGMNDICRTCDSIEADFLYIYPIVTDSTNFYNRDNGTITIPFKYVDYKHNTEAPDFRIYYSSSGTNVLANFVEIPAEDIVREDSIFFVKFRLPSSAVNVSINGPKFDDFKYKIEAQSQSGRLFQIVSDYTLYFIRDVRTIGYVGNREDRFNIIDNLKNPSCDMYWYVLFDNTKARTGNNYPISITINKKRLLSATGTETTVDNSSSLQTASIQRGSFNVDRLPSCYTIEAAYNTTIKTFRMDYKLICFKRSDIQD